MVCCQSNCLISLHTTNVLATHVFSPKGKFCYLTIQHFPHLDLPLLSFSTKNLISNIEISRILTTAFLGQSSSFSNVDAFLFRLHPQHKHEKYCAWVQRKKLHPFFCAIKIFTTLNFVAFRLSRTLSRRQLAAVASWATGSLLQWTQKRWRFIDASGCYAPHQPFHYTEHEEEKPTIALFPIFDTSWYQNQFKRLKALVLKLQYSAGLLLNFTISNMEKHIPCLIGTPEKCSRTITMAGVTAVLGQRHF